MTTLKSSQDVYKKLVDDSNDSWLLSLLSFAVIEEQKIEWMRHYKKQNNKLPTPKEIEGWYAQQPEGAMLRAQGTAENTLINYAEDIRDTLIEDEKEAIRESTLVEEIRLGRKPLPQIGLGVLSGFISSFIFTLLFAAFYFVAIVDASPQKTIDELTGANTVKNKETPHG